MKKKISLKVSKMFPCTHPRKGELTNFREKILSGEKIHTIRSNYDYWKKKIDMVNSGEAVLVLEQWVDRPYWSKVEDFMLFNSDSGIGVQKIQFPSRPHNDYFAPLIDDKYYVNFGSLIKNDGLEPVSFDDWFKNYDLSKPMAIIHFTEFRY